MPEFGRVRSFFWPIRKSECKKFIPTLLIFFLITLNYTILKSIKDAMVVTAPHSGAEIILFLKVYIILPMAILVTLIFTRLSNKFSQEKVFYIMLGSFLVFFLFFTFVLYPNSDYLHPHGLADQLAKLLPAGCKCLVSIFRNWTFTLFYVMCELWSSAILTVLFWGFANAIFSVGEAKRFYVLLGLGANTASIFSGKITQGLMSISYHPAIPYGKTAWDQAVALTNLSVVFIGVIIIFLFYWLNKNVLKNVDSIHYAGEKKEKIKSSMRSSFRYLAKSKYLICIAILVIAYNLTLNLVEVAWKNQVSLLYPDPKDFTSYMGKVTTWIGILSTFIALFVSAGAIRKFGWTFTALVTPIILLITGTIFFAFLLCDESSLTLITTVMGSTPLVLSVFFGSMQNCFSRASKFTLFDATKELSFIPLSDESKLKGKAAIDGVGSRFGKSSACLIQQGLLFCFGSLSLCLPFIAIIFLATIGVWVTAVTSLGKKFNLLTGKEPEITKDEKTPQPTT